LPSAIEQVAREYRGKGLTVLAIDIQEPREKVEAWVKSRTITSTVLLDADGAVSNAYKVRATPTVVLIGKDGKSVALALGNRPWADGKGKELLAALVGGGR
jgi:peroxiredoxin